MRLRIIVVEDEKPQAEATRHILRTIGAQELREVGIDGVEVTVANCAADARSHLRRAVEDKKPFDIAMLDLGLPENSGESESADQGLSILNFIRERKAARDVIIVSVFTELDRYVGPAFRLGASDFIGKPYNEEEMQARVLKAWSRIKESRRQAILNEMMKASLKELAPYADKGISYRLGSCFTKFTRQVRRETHELRDALLKQFGLDSPEELPGPLAQRLASVENSISGARDEWKRIQEPFKIADDSPRDLVVENAIIQLAEELRPCVAVKLDASVQTETRILSFQDAYQDNALMVIREILVGGLIEPGEPGWSGEPDKGEPDKKDNSWEVSVNIAVADGMVEIHFRDNFKPLPIELAEKVTKGENIPPRDGQWRAWGLSIVQHIALRGGGRLIVEPLEGGNLIVYRVTLAQ
ncbi:MAG TPA: response regulator [Blastocatellia bacterium]